MTKQETTTYSIILDNGKTIELSIQGTDEFVGEVMDDFRDALNSKTEWYVGNWPHVTATYLGQHLEIINTPHRIVGY